MSKRYVLSEYVELAMGQALYDKLEDNSFSGRIPSCPGVLSFAPTLKECAIILGREIYLAEWERL